MNDIGCLTVSIVCENGTHFSFEINQTKSIKSRHFVGFKHRKILSIKLFQQTFT